MPELGTSGSVGGAWVGNHPGLPIQYGFGDVSRLLLQHGLLDELRLWVHPLILGHGGSSDLLFGPAPSVGFRLVGSTTLSHGIIILNYETDKMLA